MFPSVVTNPPITHLESSFIASNIILWKFIVFYGIVRGPKSVLGLLGSPIVSLLIY